MSDHIWSIAYRRGHHIWKRIKHVWKQYRDRQQESSNVWRSFHMKRDWRDWVCTRWRDGDCVETWLRHSRSWLVKSESIPLHSSLWQMSTYVYEVIHWSCSNQDVIRQLDKTSSASASWMSGTNCHKWSSKRHQSMLSRIDWIDIGEIWVPKAEQLHSPSSTSTSTSRHSRGQLSTKSLI